MSLGRQSLVPRQTLTAAEIAQRGREIYGGEIRSQVEPNHGGQFLVVDITSHDCEIADDDMTASDRALAKNPHAVLYGCRIGAPVAYRLGASG